MTTKNNNLFKNAKLSKSYNYINLKHMILKFTLISIEESNL